MTVPIWRQILQRPGALVGTIRASGPRRSSERPRSSHRVLSEEYAAALSVVDLPGVIVWGTPSDPDTGPGFTDDRGEGTCWADLWAEPEHENAPCGKPSDPRSHLGLCTEHFDAYLRYNGHDADTPLGPVGELVETTLPDGRIDRTLRFMHEPDDHHASDAWAWAVSGIVPLTTLRGPPEAGDVLQVEILGGHAVSIVGGADEWHRVEARRTDDGDFVNIWVGTANTAVAEETYVFVDGEVRLIELSVVPRIQEATRSAGAVPAEGTWHLEEPET